MFSPFLIQTNGDQKLATFLSLIYHYFSLHLNLKENSKTVSISYRKTLLFITFWTPKIATIFETQNFEAKHLLSFLFCYLFKINIFLKY